MSFLLKKPIISRLVCGARHALSTSTSALSTMSVWLDPGRRLDSVARGSVRHASTLMPRNSRNYGTAFNHLRHKDFTDTSLLRDNNDELLALKKGPPVIAPKDFTPEKEVWVMKAFDEEWTPPAPPCELLDTTTYKIYEELWRLAANNCQLQARYRRKVKSIETSYPKLSETVTSMVAADESGSKGDEELRLKRLEDYDDALRYFSLAVLRAFDNACGRKAIEIVLGSLQEVCQKGFHISGKKSDVKLNVHNIGGAANSGFFNINYAHRSWKKVAKMDCDLDAEYRKSDVWSERNHSPNVGSWGYSWEVPDVVGVFASRNQNPLKKQFLVYKERGSIAAEVKSDCEISPKQWTKGLRQAEIQAMMSLVCHDHSAAILVSPYEAAFMAFEIHQDGFITRKKKTYTLGDGHKHMFADAFVELYRDILGYTWDRYYT